ncbi:neuronal acetylcholine receptor subunit alpha-7 isoform X14 [Planococcus citri]|uniref:neuronal acetylcholine receptor subunit alpha-7 isoform X14 n=1 Tax=Planococcus citri TaxID=170843 RepID=UPI0031F7E42F
MSCVADFSMFSSLLFNNHRTYHRTIYSKSFSLKNSTHLKSPFTFNCCRIIIIFIILIVFIVKDSEEGMHEKRLLNNLLRNYNPLERPVAVESEPLNVTFGLTLQQIIDVDEKNQILTTNAWLNLDEKNQILIANLWLTLEWVDYNLKWNSSEYGNVRDLRITPKNIWRPDILMYNSADEKFDGTYHTNVVVRSNGSCLYVPPGIFKSTCKIDITWFPFDDQYCDMKFGSWTYDGFQLDLEMKSEDGGDLSNFITNGEWYLLGMPGKKNTVVYACCPEPYVDITFIVQIRRRTLYYFFNLIVPCVLISSMALLGFTLPPDSGEKLTLGTYFNCIMFMVASSVVLTVVVLNYHHRTSDNYRMPPVTRTILLQWLPWILRMSRPGRKITLKTIRMSNRVKQMELKERSSKSLLANVLDIEDDFRHCSVGPGGASATLNSTYIRTGTSSSHHAHQHSSSSAAAITLDDSGTCSIASKELQLILKEIQFITNRMRKADEEADIISDWKFAAIVMDRFCLIVFTLFTIIATLVVLCSAPHIIVQ